MSTPDVLGNAVDADTIETALRDTIQAWLPAWLAHQERRKGWAARTLPQPRSWPTVSEFELRPGDQQPAVVIVYRGTAGAPDKLPSEWRQRWRFDVAVAVSGRDERQARQLASAYLEAIKDASRTDQTLGQITEQVRVSGADDGAYGTVDAGTQLAIYGTELEVTARSRMPLVIQRDENGNPIPPDDPYLPDPAPPMPLDVEIDIEVTPEDQPV